MFPTLGGSVLSQLDKHFISLDSSKNVCQHFTFCGKDESWALLPHLAKPLDLRLPFLPSTPFFVPQYSILSNSPTRLARLTKSLPVVARSLSLQMMFEMFPVGIDSSLHTGRMKLRSDLMKYSARTKTPGTYQTWHLLTAKHPSSKRHLSALQMKSR